MTEHDTCPCAAVEQLKEIVKNHDEKLQAHETRLADGNTSFELIRQDIRYMRESIDENTRTLKETTSKSGRRWDSAFDRAIGAVIAILLAYVATRLGLQ